MTDFCALSDVKAYLGIAPTNTNDDAVLNRLITSASQFIRSWLNRDIDQRSYTDTRDGTGHVKMTFPNYPITAVQSVQVGQIVIPQSTGPTVPGWVFTPTAIILRQYVFDKDYQNVVVTYTAGYSPIPTDIAQATIEMVTFRFKDSQRIGISSKTLAGEVITFSQKDMQAATLTLLNQYKRVQMS